MASKDTLYISSTPDDVKNAKGLSLITQNTPNGQATQIMLEELALKYGTKWDTKLINISTNVQKEECTNFPLSARDVSLKYSSRNQTTNTHLSQGFSASTPMAASPRSSTTARTRPSLSSRPPPSSSIF